MEKKLTMILACFFLSIGIALAQTQVKGVVIDQDNDEPIIGATVRVQGNEKAGAITDIEGNFTLTVPAGFKKIEVSYVGYKTQIVPVKPNMTIKLVADDHALEALVVTGYGSAKKLGTVAGSVETVDAKKFENRPVANIGDALQGQVSGVQVFTSSGEPSAGVSMSIRGQSSISASTQPLFILDGSEITADAFNALNPNDIANMTVLKDASATAIYGSRAANGVIILTSKRGKLGQKPTIAVSALWGISKATGNKEKVMNSEEWLTLQEMLDPTKLDDPGFQAMKSFYVNNGISTDWADIFFGGSAPTYQVDMSVVGGSQNTSYLISFGHYEADGIMDDSNMRREAFRVNLETKITDWLKVGAYTNLAYKKYGTTAFGGAGNSIYNKVFASRTYLPIQNYYEYDKSGFAYNADGSIDYANSTFNGFTDQRLEYFDILGCFNPYWLSEIQPSHNDNVRINENAFINLSPIKGLNIRSAVGLEWVNNRSFYRQTIQPQLGQEWETASMSNSFNTFYKWTVTNTIEYKWNIARDHQFTALVGQESMYSKEMGESISVQGIPDDRFLLPSSATKANVPGAWLTENVRNSWFGTLNYGFQDKYFVDLSIRRDGSSLFGENKRWATFGAGALMWNVTNEKFMQSQRKWLNDLALKVSYGSTGNSAISPYLALKLIGMGGQYQGQGGTGVANPGNPNLTWETVKTFNLALSGRVFNRLNFNLEFYNKATSDMLMSIPYSFTTGFGSGFGNVASMRNRGLDFSFDANIINTKNFQWNLSINGNYNSNKITDLFQGMDEYVMSGTGLMLKKGEAYGEYYMVRWVGVDPRDGQNIWLDKNGNKTKVYSEDDKVLTGKNRYAPWSGGLNTSFTWKDLTLDVQFTGMFDRYMINNERFFTENATFAGRDNQSKTMLKMWQKKGDVTKIPAKDANIQFDTHLLEDASFIRLKMVQLSYNLPQSLLMKTNGIIKGAKVFVVGRNLLTFTDYRGYDPEVNSNVSLGNYPNTRQYSVGAQITF